MWNLDYVELTMRNCRMLNLLMMNSLDTEFEEKRRTRGARKKRLE